MNDPHTTYSSYLEKIIEHKFISEILSSLWLAKIYDAEVLKPDVDGGGYDIVLQNRGVLRHVQLKTKKKGGKTRKWNIQTKLQEYPAGCVVIIIYDQSSLEIGPFHWFGGDTSTPLPPLDGLKKAKHTKADSKGNKAERPNLHELGIGKFETLSSVEELNIKLFGLKTPDTQ